jgi:hypothetical protein
MKPKASPESGLVHPESLRQPLIDVLSDLFIACWPDPDLPVEPFAHALEAAVDGLLRGNAQVQLQEAPAGLLVAMAESGRRFSQKVTEGSRRRPEAGYSYRFAVTGDRVGVVLLVDVSACRPNDEPLVFLRIASVFSVEEFDRERKAIIANQYQAMGLTHELVSELTPSHIEPDQTLDYSMEFSAPTPSPR